MRRVKILLLLTMLAAACVPASPAPVGATQASPAPVGATQALPGPSSMPGAAPTAKTEVLVVITAPEDGAVVDIPEVEVRGTTVPNAVLTLNDEIGVADESGAFAVVVPLEAGPNAINIIVSDLDGNETHLEMAVTYDSSSQ